MQTVLIYRLGSIGDAVISLPCFHRIAASFPDARRVLLTNDPVSAKAAPMASVLAGSGLIHDTIRYRLNERRWGELIRLRTEIAALAADVLVYLAQPRGRLRLWRDLAFFRCCGIRSIIGAPLASDCFFLRRDPVTNEVERQAERLARCLAPMGPIDLADSSQWDLRLDEQEERAARRAIQSLQERSFAVINVGGKLDRQDWGDDNWRRFLTLLAATHRSLGLVFIGGDMDYQRSARLAVLWPSPTINACGTLTPRESAAVSRLSRLFIGHDSGPMHLAASVGTVCVAVFGDNNPPKEWHPVGGRHRIFHDTRGVRNIDPAAVYAAVQDVLPSLATPGHRAD